MSLEELGAATTRRCLLARTTEGYRIEADLAIAVHPIPAPPEDLDATLTEATSARLLSRWGRHGVQPSVLTLAGLTDTPPTREAFALIITDRGLYLRASEPTQTSLAAIDDASLSDQLHALLPQDSDTTLFVSAEAHISVHRVEEVLKRLSGVHRGPIALAVALSPETALPAPRSSSAAARRCPDGLPDSDDVQGDLSVAALTEAFVPLRARAATCLQYADARGAAGSRMLLALRVRADGGVDQACMIADEAADDALAACVLAAAHDLRFPSPDPAGSVDVELPLVLRPNSPPAQVPVCEPTQSPNSP